MEKGAERGNECITSKALLSQDRQTVSDIRSPRIDLLEVWLNEILDDAKE